MNKIVNYHLKFFVKETIILFKLKLKSLSKHQNINARFLKHFKTHTSCILNKNFHQSEIFQKIQPVTCYLSFMSWVHFQNPNLFSLRRLEQFGLTQVIGGFDSTDLKEWLQFVFMNKTWIVSANIKKVVSFIQSIFQNFLLEVSSTTFISRYYFKVQLVNIIYFI